MSVLTDDLGNKSSKRVIGMIFGIAGVILGIVCAIIGCYVVIATPTVVTTVFTGLMTSSLIALGLTSAEKFKK